MTKTFSFILDDLERNRGKTVACRAPCLPRADVNAPLYYNAPSRLTKRNGRACAQFQRKRRRRFKDILLFFFDTLANWASRR